MGMHDRGDWKANGTGEIAAEKTRVQIGAALGLSQIGSDVHRDFEQLDELTRSKQAGMADHENAGGMRFSSGARRLVGVERPSARIAADDSARCGSSAFRSFSTPPPLSISRPRARTSATVNARPVVEILTPYTRSSAAAEGSVFGWRSNARLLVLIAVF